MSKGYRALPDGSSEKTQYQAIDDNHFSAYQTGMENKPVLEIEQAVLDARLVMAHVLKRAGVPLSTLHRAKDRGVRPLTYLRIMDAVDELKAERA